MIDARTSKYAQRGVDTQSRGAESAELEFGRTRRSEDGATLHAMSNKSGGSGTPMFENDV
jgi:hypothetical protein